MKLLYKALTLALACSLTACMNLEPKDQLADGNLWSKSSDFVSFANQFYGWTPNMTMATDGYIHSDMRSDLLTDKSAKNVYSNGTNTVPEADGDYGSGYGHIRRCNLLIKNAENYANQADIRQPLGEAYFFRAFTYFNMMQKWGDLIIVDEPIDITDARLKQDRNPRSEVADFIIADLQKAATLLKSCSDLEDGRISAEGANAMLSRVGLYEGTWQKFRGNAERAKTLLRVSFEAAKAVIDSKKYQLFQPVALGDSAQKYMFILENTKCNPAGLTKNDNHEYIFKTCYDETLRPGGQNITKGVLGNVQLVSGKMAALYLCDDGLPAAKSPRFQGYDKIDSEYKNRDARMKYTMMVPHGYYWSIYNPRTDWTSSDAEKAVAQYKDYVPSGGTGYYPQKWAVERKCEERKESFDFPIIRYAEVLLNYAEAKFEYDEKISDGDLDISLNLTRRRVNQKMPKLSNALCAANGLDMREEIRRERTVELFNEGFRIDDLKRWKTAETEMPQDFTGIHWTGEWKTKWTNPGLATNADGCLIYESGRQWAERNYLYPLPVDQLQLNPNMKQNPGW